MKEIGGYIELDTYTGSMLHKDGIKLNCGRSALAYIIKAKEIKNILMPKFMCDSCDKILRENNVSVRYYSIGMDFKPINLVRTDNEWLYAVNFYGQLSKEDICSLGVRVICDNAQAYFNEPISGVDTLYTCRKFFGVPDGGILYTDKTLKDIPKDESFNRMYFLLGRFEGSASEFYQGYIDNNHFIANEPIKRMSRLTENLLHGIDYEHVKELRTENFKYLHSHFLPLNKLTLTIPEGAFMYPLYIENGTKARKALQIKKIYIPTLWSAVFERSNKGDMDYDLAQNILPLPVDQRYSIKDMEYMCREIDEILA